jgi:hypothetical protein
MMNPVELQTLLHGVCEEVLLQSVLVRQQVWDAEEVPPELGSGTALLHTVFGILDLNRGDTGARGITRPAHVTEESWVSVSLLPDAPPRPEGMSQGAWNEMILNVALPREFPTALGFLMVSEVTSRLISEEDARQAQILLASGIRLADYNVGTLEDRLMLHLVVRSPPLSFIATCKLEGREAGPILFLRDGFGGEEFSVTSRFDVPVAHRGDA